MKQKILNYLKLGILVFGISILLFNCQQETVDEIITSPKGENSFLKKGKLENYGQLSAYVEDLQRKPTVTTDDKESTLEDNNGFTILYDQEMNIQEEDSYVTYSIPIYKNHQIGGTFSNLVVRFSDTEATEAFILNYKPDSEYLDMVATDERTPFLGSVTSESLQYDGSLDSLKESSGGCVSVTIKYCDFEEGRHGDTHLGGDNCTVGYYWFVTTTICFGDDYPQLIDVQTPGSGSPSASNYVGSTSGGGISTGNGGTVHPPVIVPTVPRTHSRLYINGLSLEMSEWLNSLENQEFRQEMIDFLSEEDPLTRNKLEAYLMIKSESSTQPWVDSTGNFNNISSLGFNQLRHVVDTSRGYIYTEFKLANGDIIMRGDFSETSEFLPLTFYYSKEANRLFEIPEPFNGSVGVNLDFLWENFWATVQTGVRYCTPLEDVVILIDGKDFDGVESSRAISGIMLLVEVTPIGKVFKIVKKSGQVITNTVPIVTRIVNNIYKIQRKLFNQYKGLIANMSNARKGRWAEMGTDVDMIGKGYQEQHGIRITDIDNGGHNGVDHVFKNPETGEYLIVETKYKSSGNTAYTNPPNPNTQLPKQMSNDWLTHNNNLANSVGQNLANDILSSNFIKLAAIVNPDGTITYRLIDELGNVINGANGIYIP